MAPTTKSRFNADAVICLKLQVDEHRLEIKFTDASGAEHVVSLPVPAAVDLATFIQDACSFTAQLKGRPKDSADT